MKVCTAKITPVSDHPLPIQPSAPVDIEGAEASHMTPLRTSSAGRCGRQN